MLVMLDWDGTVCNSAGRIVACMQRASVEAGLPVLKSQAISNIIGLGMPEALTQLFPEASSEQREQLRRCYSKEWLAARSEPLPLFGGVLATLDRLLTAGHQLAVATGKSRRGLKREFLELGLEAMFVASRCADETASKPNPLMLHELLRQTATPASEAVMVGDTSYDLEMAAAAEVPAIGVSYGVHSRDRLQACNPQRIIDSFPELLCWPPLSL